MPASYDIVDGKVYVPTNPAGHIAIEPLPGGRYQIRRYIETRRLEGVVHLRLAASIIVPGTAMKAALRLKPPES